MTQKWTLNVQEGLAGDAILTFPPDLLEKAGWKEGDTLEWIDLGDGSWELKKKPVQISDLPTEWVLVEAVSSFRMRYVVQVPAGKSEWALDTVTMNEACEFSQEHLGEQIVSHRVVSKEEALELFDADNAYLRDWPEEKKMGSFTPWKRPDGSDQSEEA